jgi:hypothetical protein
MKKKLLNTCIIWQLFLCLVVTNAIAAPRFVAVITDKKTHIFKVELARTQAEKAQGLMGRKTLVENAGMLFMFFPSQRVSMWMKNTLLDLDMLFVDEKQKIVAIAQAKAEDESRITPSQSVRYVLEIKGGLAHKYGIKVGHSLQLVRQ